MCYKKCAIKKFLGFCELQKGCKYIGIFMTCISIICIIAISVELAMFSDSANCSSLILLNAYSFCINALVYSVLITFVHLWFIWGVSKAKATVVLSWVVVMSIWWMQSCCLMLIFLLYMSIQLHLWILLLVLAVLGYLIFGYFILVGYGYWVQLWKIKHPNEPVGTA